MSDKCITHLLEVDTEQDMWKRYLSLKRFKFYSDFILRTKMNDSRVALIFSS